MKTLSNKAKECLKQWQEEIDKTGMSSLLKDGEVAQELLKAGYVEESPMFGAFQVIVCDKCNNIICKCNNIIK